MKEILKNIRAIREARGLSQDQLADIMKISQSQYARFERGATKTDLETLNEFAKAVEMTMVDIITFPRKYIDSDQLIIPEQTVEAILQIKLKSDKKDQILKLVFGENNLEILSK